MTSIEAIPQSQKEDLIEFIYIMMTLEEKEETKKKSATSAKTRSAQ